MQLHVARTAKELPALRAFLLTTFLQHMEADYKSSDTAGANTTTTTQTLAVSTHSPSALSLHSLNAALIG